jgi:hypothetical protein
MLCWLGLGAGIFYLSELNDRNTLALFSFATVLKFDVFPRASQDCLRLTIPIEVAFLSQTRDFEKI